MALTTVPRNMVKLEYAAVRLPFTLLEQHVVARHCDDAARLGLGFERFLGSLDGFAGRLLADDDISRRGQALMRRTDFLANARLDTKAQTRRAQAEQKLQAQQAEPGQAHEDMDDNVADACHKEQEGNQRGCRTADAWAEAEKAQAEHAAEERAAEEPDVSVERAATASTVDVTFTLPAEVQADSVALCGGFNEWSAETIWLEHDSDGSWRATVALEPGHSYRYLLDGERWENAWQADGYVPNSYGSDDSVVLVQ